MEGRYGVWDGDFRFDVYSMGITTLAAETITVEVDFEKSTNNETKDYFNTCLSLPEKIQVCFFSRAAKRTAGATGYLKN